jgi:hypothetical protein
LKTCRHLHGDLLNAVMILLQHIDHLRFTIAAVRAHLTKTIYTLESTNLYAAA